MRLLPFDYAVRNLKRSPVRFVGGLLGSALVVLLMLAAGGFVRGMQHSFAISGLEDNVILVSAGSEESVERSEIDPSTPGIVLASIPGIRQRLGQPYIAEESHVQLEVKTSSDSAKGIAAFVRGVTPNALLVHRQVRLIDGRLPRQGSNELILGSMVGSRLGVPDALLAAGNKLWIDARPWTIVGKFEAAGTVMESEIWCALQDLQIVIKRTTLSCVVLTLGDATFDDVAVFCQQRLDLQLVAIRESDYYAGLQKFFGPIRAMVWVTAILGALGGLFGGLNTMYAAFASRVRELGMLQTLGYSRRAIMANLIQESVIMASAGALLASLIGIVCLNGLSVRFSLGVFGLTMDGPTLMIGLGSGILLGLFGSLLPALRCLRMPISESLKAA
jgi:putative ABC transport system permease protein